MIRALRKVRAKIKKTIVNPPDPFRDIQRLLASYQVAGIIDGGAYYGDISQRFLRLFPCATIYAFEPQPDTFLVLKNNVGGFPNVRVFNLALSSSGGSADFYTNYKPYTSSLLPRSYWGEKYHAEQTQPVGSCKVNLVTLDQWARDARIEDVDIIKLDVQGAELEALHGSTELLKTCVKLVFLEVQFVPLYEGASPFFQVASFLHQNDFHLFQLYNLQTGADGQLIYGDALFVRGDLRR